MQLFEDSHNVRSRPTLYMYATEYHYITFFILMWHILSHLLHLDNIVIHFPVNKCHLQLCHQCPWGWIFMSEMTKLQLEIQAKKQYFSRKTGVREPS